MSRILVHFALGGLLVACGNTLPRPAPRPAPPFTLAGSISHDHDAPAPGAVVAITDISTGSQVANVAADGGGRFGATLPAGTYALAVADRSGFAWIDKVTVPNTAFQIALSGSCQTVSGTSPKHGTSTRIRASRRTTNTGDTFVALVESNGSFSFCLPEAFYDVSVAGDTLSPPVELSVPATTHIDITGFSRSDIERSPAAIPQITSELRGLISDIVDHNPTVIGLGEGTHGTGEFVSAREELTLALIREADVQLILFEIDAINAFPLDDYVNGADVDIAKAVAALGFWVTDTYEFIRFLGRLRDYNEKNADKKIHVGGVDLQNTVRPVAVLVDHASTLMIDANMQAVLQVVATERAKKVPELPAAQRGDLIALLSRLATPRSEGRDDILVAVAARSLALQLEYWNGDMVGNYRRRRDVGMANLATFIASQRNAKRACLWAHDGHITKEPGLRMLGHNLAADRTTRYYSVGFYLHQGSARAWDPEAAIGVISHPIPEAPPYTVEDVIMRAARMPDIAWIPLRRHAALQDWLRTPRFVRELGAVYTNLEDMMTLRQVSQAFDAVVVLKTGHDSSPTPTGVRKIVHE